MAFPEVIVEWCGGATSALLLLAVTATGIRSPMHLLLKQGWRSLMPVIAATITVLALGLAGAMAIS